MKRFDEEELNGRLWGINDEIVDMFWRQWSSVVYSWPCSLPWTLTLPWDWKSLDECLDNEKELHEEF